MRRSLKIRLYLALGALVLGAAVCFLLLEAQRGGQCIQVDYSRCDYRRLPSAEPRSDLSGRVSLAEVDAETLLFANAVHLFVFDKAGGKATVLQPDFSQLAGSHQNKKRKNLYVPTGVALDCDGDVYLANDKGNNILRGKIQGGKIVFTQEYRSKQSLGAKNVSVDRKRDILVSANYDGNTVTAFQISSGKQLWSTEVGKAHGVLIDKDFVYAAGLATRDLQKLALPTGEVVLKRGSIGWKPAKNQYLGPVSVQNLDADHLVVADAQSGYISKVRKDNLKVVSYFGGNGPGPGQFNYPYVALRLSDGLYVCSAYRDDLLRLRLNPLRGDTLWRHADLPPQAPSHMSLPGKNWNKYLDMDPRHTVGFYGRIFRMGFGKICDRSTRQEFALPDAGTLYGAPNRLCFMQGRQLSENCAILLSSSSAVLYAVSEPAPDLPAILTGFQIERDMWLTEDGGVIGSRLRLSRGELEKIIEERAAVLKEKLRSQRRLTLTDLASCAITSFEEKGEAFLSREDIRKRFDNSFTSPEGRKFLWRYHRAPDDLAGIQKSAVEYYRNISGVPLFGLDEYLLVGMLSGVSPRSVAKTDAPFAKIHSEQRLSALHALNTPSLRDYASAEEIADSKFFFYPPDSEAVLNRLEIIWHSGREAGEMVRISGVEANGAEVVLFQGKVEKRMQSGYAVSDIPLNSRQVYPKYLFEELKGGKQKRLLLRAFTPEWEKKISDPLLSFAREVSLKKPYGAGVQKVSSDEDLENAQTWHCGNFSAWFARHLPFGFHPRKIRILGIASKNGANHAVVEITFDDTVKVIDPTLGIVYDSGIRQMQDGSFDFERHTHFSRPVSPIFNLYYGPQFFYQSEILQQYPVNHTKEQ